MTDVVLNFGAPTPKAEPGTYPAACVGVEAFVIDEGTADAKTLLRWLFALDNEIDPDTNMVLVLDGVTSTATGPRSKMRPWVVALNGAPLDEKVSLSDLSHLLTNKPCLVTVTINAAGYSKVENVLAPLGKGKA